MSAHEEMALLKEKAREAKEEPRGELYLELVIDGQGPYQYVLNVPVSTEVGRQYKVQVTRMMLVPSVTRR
jgi:hypothetical protein